MLIGFLAFVTLVKLQQVVRALLASFCIHVQLLISIQASLWSGPVNSLCQIVIVLLTNVFLTYRFVDLIDLLFIADSTPIPNFQYLWPDQESHPVSNAYRLFYHSLCVRYCHKCDQCLGHDVRFFHANSRVPIDII